MVCMSAGEARVALALLVAVAAAHAHKRTGDDLSPMPFKFMVRYGRSPERLITPRTNRWFNSRYGKRSESFPMQEDPPTQEVPAVLRDPPDSRDGAPAPGEQPTLHGPPCLEGSTWPLRQGEGERMSHMLSCVYTGVLALYRCTRTQLPDKISRRSDPVPSEEE